MRPRVYICAPWVDARRMSAWLPILASYGLENGSSWIAAACSLDGPDPLDAKSIQKNDEELHLADAVLVISREGAGGEMFCEFTRAIMAGIPVFWVGREILSCRRAGVTICDDIQDAFETIRGTIK